MKEKAIYQGKRKIIKYSPDEVASFLKEIKMEFYSFMGLSNFNNEKNNNSSYSENSIYFINKEEENTQLYFSKYIRYILYEFNSSIVNMLIIYINKSNFFPKIYKKEQYFIKNMIGLLKHLMMNEIEIAYFTLLIDILGWENNKIEHWIYLSILGIITKKYCLKDNDPSLILLLNIFSRKYPRFLETYSNFIENQKITEKTITISSLNKRFSELSKPINTYCRKNYINFDGIIDKIVKSSQPYFKSDFSDNSDDKEQKTKTITSEPKTQYGNLFYFINNQKDDINLENNKYNEHDLLNILNTDYFHDFINYIENDGSLNLDDI